MSVAVLCVAKRSVYRGIPGLELYDELRDAFSFAGGMPVVAHPPCSQWCRLSHFARADVLARVLGFHCVVCVQEYGGVLEQPAFSKLWVAAELPLPGESDRWGRTYAVDQEWFGHKARKPTWLYMVNCSPAELPFRLSAPAFFWRSGPGRPRLPDSARSGTPAAFAAWLIEIAAKAARTSR